MAPKTIRAALIRWPAETLSNTPAAGAASERHPTAAIWLFAALQGAAMLGLNVVLRVLVS